jgi:hypothetical protein
MNTLDVINSMRAADAVQRAYLTATQLQDHRDAQQVAGVALYLNELCRVHRLDPRELLNKADRMAADADTNYAVEVRALRQFIREEF